ncbi:MAG: coenzyme biosynthesis protein [Pedosphaera sp.]|nr:coenzyme biosynthesis protein [Pedosphaera sp.]
MLGLFSLREGARLNIFATKAVRNVLAKSMGLERIFDTFCGADWHEPGKEFVPLPTVGGTSKKRQASGGLEYRMIVLPGKAPPFARDMASGGIHSVAYQFLDRRTGGRLLVAPDVSAVNEELQDALESSDAVLFDGTFWSSDELKQVKAKARTADQMGHLTIKDFSLDLLKKLPARRKVYIHINNTNPVLAKRSRERAAVERAGIMIGHDGLEFEL